MLDFLGTTGKRVRILRNDLDLEQKELAQRASTYNVDLSQSAISKIERDVMSPSAKVIAALARALGTTADYLLMLSDDPVPPSEEETPIVREAPASYVVSELGRVASELPPEAQTMLLQLAKYMRGPDARIIE